MNDSINRQDAIKLAIDLDYESRGILKESRCREIEKRYNMIPTAQPDVPDTNVGGTISRQTVIDAMCTLMNSWFGDDSKDEKEEIEWIIKHLPSAQPLTAYVISDEDGNIKCSNCGSSECWGNYCMNCGRKLKVKEKNEQTD